MLIRNPLLFIFLIVFSFGAHTEEEKGLFDDLFQGVQLSIGYGNLGIDKFTKSNIPVFEFKTITNDSRKNPQALSVGYVVQKQGSAGRYRGEQNMFYVLYDYGYRLNLTRRFNPFAIVGLGYSYTRRSAYYQVDSKGFAIGKPISNNTQGILGYVGARYNTKIYRKKWQFDVRYYQGEMKGIALFVSLTI